MPIELLYWAIGSVVMLGIVGVCWHNLTAPGPGGAWPRHRKDW